MKKCQRCGKRYDPSEETDTFMMECGLDYNGVTEDICAECASQALDDNEDGIYIETCSKCGCKYDPVIAESIFRDRFPNSSNSVWTFIMCADCSSDYEDDLLHD